MRTKGFIWIGISYILAFSVGFIAFFAMTKNGADDLLSLLILDIVATVIVWAFGLIFKNASFYDPFWSVAPPILILLYMCKNNFFGVTNIIFLAAISIWSIRLTLNWAINFKSIKVEDWRYVEYRKKFPKLWHLINFFGINLMPTLLVFFALAPSLFMLKENAPFNALALFGAAVIIGGTLLEFFADREMQKHLKSENKADVCRIGLWKYSRHPNYLGEIFVWFGVYFMMLAIDASLFFLVFGAIAMVCLFCFISIPLMEKRQLSRRPSYQQYKDETSALLFFKLKNPKGNTDEAQHIN